MTEAERIWSSKSDEALLEAAADLASFTEEGQRVIRAELKTRGFEDPWEQGQFTAADVGTRAMDAEAESTAPDCLRCEIPLSYIGEKRFHEGTRWGLIGELGHLFEKSESFHVYACPECGHVEFFVDIAKAE